VIREKIQHCLDGTIEGFKERVTLLTKSGHQIETAVFISVYDSFSGAPAMIGQVTLLGDHPLRVDHGHLASEVLKILKGEHIQITQSLSDKLSGVFNLHNESAHAPNPNFFSRRETEVLCLSMQGLPMKMIADKLSISDRTVEKHREKLMEKTGTNNIVEVIVYALRNNLIEI
jgi:DNA-binding NarL/FixJ family response regulator